jgi:hypothetical protein
MIEGGGRHYGDVEVAGEAIVAQLAVVGGHDDECKRKDGG